LTLREHVKLVSSTEFLPSADDLSSVLRLAGFLPVKDAYPDQEEPSSPNYGDSIFFHYMTGDLCDGVRSMTNRFRSRASVMAARTGIEHMRGAYEANQAARGLTISIVVFFGVTDSLFDLALDDLLVGTGATSECTTTADWYPLLLRVAGEHGYGSGPDDGNDLYMTTSADAFETRQIRIADASGIDIELVTGPSAELVDAAGSDHRRFDVFDVERMFGFYEAGHASSVGVVKDGGIVDLQMLYPLPSIEAAVHLQIQSSPYMPDDVDLTDNEAADLALELIELQADISELIGDHLWGWIDSKPIIPEY